MSYNIPLSPVPVAGEGIPYTWFTDLQNALEALRLGTTGFAYARCNIFNSATQTIGTGAFTSLTFDSETLDPLSMHSTSVNTSRITVPSGMDGTYLISGATSWASNATGIRQMQVIKNGSATAIATRDLRAGFAVGGLGPVVALPPTLLVLAATDYIELQVYQDSGGNLAAGNAARELASQFIVARMI